MVLLNGAATDDPDGSNLLLSEQWSQVAGPPVVLGNDDETVAYFRPTQTGRYRFRLDVSDGFNADSDVTVVRVIECVHDVRDGLGARGGFEEGEGALALESASGLWNGALEGPAWSDLGVTDRGGTLDFDGVTDVVQVGGLDVAGAAMTLTAWIRPDDFDVADGRILSKASGVGEQDHHWMLSTIGVGSERRLRFRLRTARRRRSSRPAARSSRASGRSFPPRTTGRACGSSSTGSRSVTRQRAAPSAPRRRRRWPWGTSPRAVARSTGGWTTCGSTTAHSIRGSSRSSRGGRGGSTARPTARRRVDGDE